MSAYACQLDQEHRARIAKWFGPAGPRPVKAPAPGLPEGALPRAPEKSSAELREERLSEARTATMQARAAEMAKVAELVAAVRSAEQALASRSAEDDRAPISVRHIQLMVAAHYGVSLIDMKSARRDARTVRPRQIAMWLAKTLTLRSLPDLGRRFGGRDHTTVLYAIRKYDGLRAADPATAAELDELMDFILAPPGAAVTEGEACPVI